MERRARDFIRKMDPEGSGSITKEAFIQAAAALEGKHNDGTHLQLLSKAKVDIIQISAAFKSFSFLNNPECVEDPCIDRQYLARLIAKLGDDIHGEKLER